MKKNKEGMVEKTGETVGNVTKNVGKKGQEMIDKSKAKAKSSYDQMKSKRNDK